MLKILILPLCFVLPLITSTLCTSTKQPILDMIQNMTVPGWMVKKMQAYRNMGKRDMPQNNSDKVLLFKDYIKKFNPNKVLSRIVQKKRAQGLNVSLSADFHEIFEGMDPTDDLLRLDLATIGSGRRKWTPLGHEDTEAPNKRDVHSLRQRFWELIRHTIYRTRNKLVIMQMLRAKYRNSPLYKMGFLFSKIDTACKSFAAFTYRSIHVCVGRIFNYVDRIQIPTLLSAEERLVNKWFEIELLIDLLHENHENAKAVVEEHMKDRQKKWKFIE